MLNYLSTNPNISEFYISLTKQKFTQSEIKFLRLIKTLLTPIQLCPDSKRNGS